jgi:hypothetical protein
MTEHEVFETRLRAALAVHVANGPIDFDAHGFARSVVEAEPRRQGRGTTLPWPRIVIPRIAWVFIATALLITVLAASALLAGARPFAGPASWQRVVLPTPDGATAQLTVVVQTGSGYLGVGSTCLACDGQSVGLVWTSHDGLAWDPVETGDTFEGAELSAVVAADEGLAAVGSTWLEGANRAAAWSSPDGLTWSPAASVAAADGSRIADVAFANGRYVAAGWELSSPGGDLIPRIWWSDDAANWVQAADLAAGPSFLNMLTGVAAGGPGFVAVGHEAGIWTSADGDAWSLSYVSIGDPHTSVVDIATGRDGQLVVAARVGRMGVSEDGEAWTWATLPELSAGDEYLEDRALVATDWGFVAVSTQGPSGPGGGLWTSRDGITWMPRQKVPGLPMSAPLTVIRAGDAILVSGPSGTWALPGGASTEAAIP